MRVLDSKRVEDPGSKARNGDGNSCRFRVTHAVSVGGAMHFMGMGPRLAQFSGCSSKRLHLETAPFLTKDSIVMLVGIAGFGNLHPKVKR